MGKTLVTGANGFIGAHVARALAERGDDLRLGAPGESGKEAVEDLGAHVVRLDVLDRRSVRRALKDVDRVFHTAGVRSLRPEDADEIFDVNVGGAKLLLEECLSAGVERVVMTSSAAALGTARRGSTIDETAVFRAGRLGIPYVNAVHEAEVEAFRLAAQGLPLVCVNPPLVLGPGDVHGASTRLVRNFLLGRVPAYADGAVCVVDVRDLAGGHLLADELGELGERYVLGGRNFTFDRLFADLGRLSGVDPPIKVPRGLARVVGGLLPIGPGRSTLSAQEVLAASQFWTYSSAKAKRELGWRARPHEETLEATIEWYMDREHDRIVRARRSQQLQYRVAGIAIAAGEGVTGFAGRALRVLRR